MKPIWPNFKKRESPGIKTLLIYSEYKQNSNSIPKKTVWKDYLKQGSEEELILDMLTR